MAENPPRQREIGMDGRLAILFNLVALLGESYEGEGWTIERADMAGMLTTSYGIVQYQTQNWGEELRFTQSYKKWKHFNPVIDVAITDKGGAWLGLGLYQQFDMDINGTPLFVGFTMVPGIYMQGEDVDLGIPLQFRSGVEMGVRFENGWQASLSFDHRSNADVVPWNPGLETIQLRISKSFN